MAVAKGRGSSLRSRAPRPVEPGRQHGKPIGHRCGRGSARLGGRERLIEQRADRRRLTGGNRRLGSGAFSVEHATHDLGSGLRRPGTGDRSFESCEEFLKRRSH